MRIVVINWSSRKVGGAEDYLDHVLAALSKEGHRLAFASEVDIPESRDRIRLPDSTPLWDVSLLGRDAVLGRIREWGPDLIYAHGPVDVSFESAYLDIGPAVYFAHNYYGTCISGLKTFKRPVVRPCERRFGAACLLHYFPRRCGGLNPVTMLQLYFRESRRMANLARYRGVVTHSAYMRREYIRHGLPEDRVHNFVRGAEPEPDFEMRPVLTQIEYAPAANKECWNLLFVGRMEMLKGGDIFLDALQLAAVGLTRKIHVDFAGDGPARADWERKAAQIHRDCPSVDIEFSGWLEKSKLEERYRRSDLLVVPSVWPEPFGRIGPEAGAYGVPVAAFAVGGVGEWLFDGVNGYSAPGDPPTAKGLAEAILKCLRDPGTHSRLRAGALRVAGRFSMERHLKSLAQIFAAACRHDPGALQPEEEKIS